MVERVESLYKLVKTDLIARENIFVVGELRDSNESDNDWLLTEKVRFYLSPVPEVDFNEQQLRGVIESLKLEGSGKVVIGTGWREILSEKGDRIKSFLFGGLIYYETIKSIERVLVNKGRVPSKREINLHIYPTYDYANQIYIYQQNL